VLDDPSFSHDTAGNEKLSLGNSWVKPGWSVPQFTFSAATWSARCDGSGRSRVVSPGRLHRLIKEHRPRDSEGDMQDW